MISVSQAYTEKCDRCGQPAAVAFAADNYAECQSVRWHLCPEHAREVIAEFARDTETAIADVTDYRTLPRAEWVAKWRST